MPSSRKRRYYRHQGRIKYLNHIDKKESRIQRAYLDRIAIIISVAAVIVSCLSMYFLKQQNDKIETQNLRIIQQNQLEEASRRSSLVFLFNNVMDAIDRELKREENLNRELSEQLIGRIVALSLRLKPYRAYDYEKDSLGPLKSPERGQLLINLLESKLAKKTLTAIYFGGSFEYAALENYRSPEYSFLERIKLKNAFMDNSEWRDAYFKRADLSNSSMRGLKCSRTQFDYADFENADARHSSWFDNTSIYKARLVNTNFYDATIRSSDLRGALFGSCNMEYVEMIECDLSDASFVSQEFYWKIEPLSTVEYKKGVLKNAYFINCNLSNTKFEGVYVDSMVLSYNDYSLNQIPIYFDSDSPVHLISQHLSLKEQLVEVWKESEPNYEVKEIVESLIIDSTPLMPDSESDSSFGSQRNIEILCDSCLWRYEFYRLDHSSF